MAHIAIDWNKYMEGLAGKANIALDNVAANIDFVVESRVNTDGSWYRKYKSGWLEQGGEFSFEAGRVDKQINFIKPMANTSYNIVMTLVDVWVGYMSTLTALKRQTTNFTVARDSNNEKGLAGKATWYACGQGA